MTAAEQQAKNRVDRAIESLGRAVDQVVASHKAPTPDQAAEIEQEIIEAFQHDFDIESTEHRYGK